MSNNFYQAFNSISDSMTKTVPKEIKMTNEVVFTESTPLISKDIYRTYRHCRNIEIRPPMAILYLSYYIYSILSFSLWLSTCIDMLSMLLFSTKTSPKIR